MIDEARRRPGYNHPLLAAARERVVVVDGGMGTSVQSFDLTLDDFEGLEGCNEVLVRTRPDVVRQIHESFLEVGCDAVETDTFGGAPWVLGEYGLEDETESLNEAAARIAREACDAFGTDRWVLGSIGPGTRSPTLSLGKDPAEANDYIDYDTMVEGYVRQSRGLLAGGSDAIIVETCFDLLQAKAAIWGAHLAIGETDRTVPILVQVTIEANINTMLLGSEVGAALTALEPLPIDVLGINCATGPEDMREHVRYLSEQSPLPISVIPNAGIPSLSEDGDTLYPLEPEGLAAAHREFVTEFGVAIVGGCCGTTPDHLREVVEAVRDFTPRERDPQLQPSLASLYAPVPIEQDNSFLIVGERMNANGSKKFRELLLEEDLEAQAGMAAEQVREGAHALDVCVDYVGRDGSSDLVPLVERLATQSTLPLVVDSTEVEVIRAGLQRLGGRAMINSVNLEDGRTKADQLFPMAYQFGAGVVCLAIDEEGQARTADWKLDACKRIAELAREHGLRNSDLIFDTLTFPLGSGQEDLRRDGMETLEAIRRVKEEIPGAYTILGLSNVSFGLSPAARQALNSVFLAMAMEYGLDAAIVHAGRILPLHQIDDEVQTICRDLVQDNRGTAGKGGTADENYDPLHALMERFEGASLAGSGAEELAAMAVADRLEKRIIDGNKDGLGDDLDQALSEGYAPLDIINQHLLAGMKVVGDLFGEGKMQLPFVLQSAECMKAAVAHLEPYMEASDDGGKAKVLLATVKGDVHDIGKNLVDIILSNNGFDVHNIGIKQPIDNIIHEAQEFGADAIGLSGLLVKSTVIMKSDLEEMQRRELQDYPVLLGGAALNRGYVEMDLREVYEGPLFYCKDAFAGLQTMDELVEHKDAGGWPDDWGTIPIERPQKRAREEAATAPAEPVSRSDVATDVPVPTPPFWGSRVVRGISLDELAGFLNKVALFRNQWGLDKNSWEEGEAALRKILAYARSEQLLRPEVVYGYWPANGDGNDIVVWAGPDSDEEAARWTLPRQTKGRQLCMADYLRPIESGERDAIAFQAVTVGPKVSERTAELFAQDAYTDYLYLHGLGVEMAEALAEYWHRRIREELDIHHQDAAEVEELFKLNYQGARFSFGYPACPDLEQRKPLFDLLDGSRIGLDLSEEFQLHPEQATDALVFHHPEARYFSAR
ncbi:methionine synthase [Egibacter rhizosphaerae]|uniref:Methionine synthase n=1 Tax=Egibacter rhizosphaerae TaxID=1670831 RepID=A0A411YJH2_9ACTN|nr:methionine synthase [Egibacter rhizosphaerae]QBI21367.1 methionine synthase [Egibacter rhizosphaerae]